MAQHRQQGEHGGEEQEIEPSTRNTLRRMILGGRSNTPTCLAVVSTGGHVGEFDLPPSVILLSVFLVERSEG